MRQFWRGFKQDRSVSHRSLEREIHSGDRVRTIAALRFMLAEWGVDTSDMTDDEIEAAVKRFGEVARSVGLTAAEATAAFASVGDAAERMGRASG